MVEVIKDATVLKRFLRSLLNKARMWGKEKEPKNCLGKGRTDKLVYIGEGQDPPT